MTKSDIVRRIKSRRSQWLGYLPFQSRDILDGLASRKLARRGLRGVKRVIAAAHEGLKPAAAKVPGAAWQRCRVPFMRHALAHANNNGRRAVPAFTATAFAQNTPAPARKQWRHAAGQLRSRACP